MIPFLLKAAEPRSQCSQDNSAGAPKQELDPDDAEPKAREHRRKNGRSSFRKAMPAVQS